MNAARHTRPPARVALSEYTDAIRAGWTDGDLTRVILHDLPRNFPRRTSDTGRCRIRDACCYCFSGIRSASPRHDCNQALFHAIRHWPTT